MLKNDKWITEQAISNDLIKPFTPSLITKTRDFRKVISYGVSSFGYDITLSPKDFRIFSSAYKGEIDPKRFNPNSLEQAELHKQSGDKYFILPGNSYGLGFSTERLKIPNNITVICVGKSTYARCGVIANITPIEAGWEGYLTLEFSNSGNADCRIYANEGVVQLLFFEGEPCENSYSDRNGKYQNQNDAVTLPRV